MEKILICVAFAVLSLLATATDGQNEITFSYKFNNRSFTSVGLLYTVYPEIKVDTPNSVITAINGSAVNDSSFGNVEGFYVSSKILRYFPRNVHEFFENLRGIEIYNSQLKFISKSDLMPYKKLMSLSLTSNHLAFIENDVFDQNTLLLYLDLSGNPLMYIGYTAFSNLVSLSSIDINGNLCSDLRYARNYQQVRDFLEQLRTSECTNSNNPQLTYAIERYSHFNGKNSSCYEMPSNCSDILNDKDNQIKKLEFELSLCHQNSNQTTPDLENELQLCLNYSSEFETVNKNLSEIAYRYLQEFSNCSSNLYEINAENAELKQLNENLEWELILLVEAHNSANYTIQNLTDKLYSCEQSLEELTGGNMTTWVPETTSSVPNNSTEGNQTEDPESEENGNESEGSDEGSEEMDDSKEHKGGKHKKYKEEKFVEVLLKVKSKYVKKYAKK